jgi:hypothetical protein
MNDLKSKPAKHLSLFSKISAFIFFVVNYEIRVVAVALGGDSFSLPGQDETLGLIYASIFLGSIFVAVDLSIILQNIKGTRNK